MIMDKITNIFGALSDPIRLRILALIAHETELCVCELVEALEMSQPKISRHCRALNEANLVDSRREAQWVLYSIANDIPDWAKQSISAAIEGVKQDPQYAVDCERLKTVERPPVRCGLKEKEAC
ncbi:ArsR family transcriptional regulator [Cohaesibacter sp. ES.047]|uniref:ArsR/SmtB family transcription factor n=1 Tax=Cohaesibacter sp. ES.047 TaxID=1798205 RepID=UPI000BC0096E|nr:metalloregulator ArsR/SmtB family transcription factor [Cohaesibacter sp. ES.047]SNY90320.1 ArsR family transcriptional regulator [Cohaesibacter sp. ES.047]